MHVLMLRQTAACCHGAAVFDKRQRAVLDFAATESHPPLEGSRRAKLALWVDANEMSGGVG
jgi:hypothetical protein